MLKKPTAIDSQLAYLFSLVLLTALIFSAQAQQNDKSSAVTKTEIRETEEGYRLFLNGEKFYVKGAGVDKGSIEALAAHGANSFRTWSTHNGEEVLDLAEKLGLKVMMGIWVGLERHGFDYNDPAAVASQLKEIRKSVKKYKDHPALMLWGIGNEMNLQSTNPKVWDAVNDISKMIHEVDPNHLTTTPLAGIDKRTANLVSARASDLDFLCVQLYAPIDHLPKIMEESQYAGPILVTEWGATGYWEVPKTSWGAPIENHSSKKADLYLRRYQNSILSQSEQVMGSFVFLWGQKQERTPTWFGMFVPNGNETEAVDMMHYAWNNEWPKNRSPRLNDFTLDESRPADNIKLRAGETYQAKVEVADPDNDNLSYIWEIRRESQANSTGGDAEYIPAVLTGLFADAEGSQATFAAPARKGAYRLFIYVEDGQNHTAHANIPFWVEE